MSTPKCVYNYEQLRSIAPPSPPGPHGFACDYLFVAGLPDPQQRGLEGFFEWLPESTANDNGGTVIKPSVLKLTDKGRWHRAFEVSRPPIRILIPSASSTRPLFPTSPQPLPFSPGRQMFMAASTGAPTAIRW
jgi:hypothetical protein